MAACTPPPLLTLWAFATRVQSLACLNQIDSAAVKDKREVYPYFLSLKKERLNYIKCMVSFCRNAFFFLFFTCVHTVCVCLFVCVCVRMEVSRATSGRSPFLPPCGPRASNSGSQASQRAPLPTDLSHKPRKYILFLELFTCDS